MPVDFIFPVRTATLVVAASNANARSKRYADFVCNGGADELAIQAAINALPAVGGRIILTEGQYEIDGPWTPVSNCKIEGQGDSTVLNIDTLVPIVCNINGVNNAIVEGIVFQTTQILAVRFIQIRGNCEHIEIKYCGFLNSFDPQILADPLPGETIQDLHYYRNWSRGGRRPVNNGTFVVSSDVGDPWGGGGGSVIGVWIERNRITDYHYSGLQVYTPPANPARIQRAFLLHNELEMAAGSPGGSMIGVNGQFFDCSHNTCRRSWGTGIDSAGGQHGNISDNILYDAAFGTPAGAISIEQGCLNISVQNNEIHDSPRGIQVMADVAGITTNIQVNNNRGYNISGIGLALGVAGFVMQRVTARGNQMYGSLAGGSIGIRIRAATNCVISENTVRNFETSIEETGATGADENLVHDNDTRGNTSRIITISGANSRKYRNTSEPDLADVFGADRYPLLYPIVSSLWTDGSSGGGRIINYAGSSFLSVETLGGAGAIGLGRLSDLMAGVNVNQISWDKKFALLLTFLRWQGDANTVAYIHLKHATSHGDLAGIGIGLKIYNFALWGEGYRTGRAEVDLSELLVTNQGTTVLIVHDPDVPRVDFIVNGSWRAALTNTINIPNAQGGVAGYLVFSITNGVTADNRILQIQSPVLSIDKP